MRARRFDAEVAVLALEVALSRGAQAPTRRPRKVPADLTSRFVAARVGDDGPC
jgi:hypothetical protein